jgi:hypothetical protein
MYDLVRKMRLVGIGGDYVASLRLFFRLLSLRLHFKEPYCELRLNHSVHYYSP